MLGSGSDDRATRRRRITPEEEQTMDPAISYAECHVGGFRSRHVLAEAEQHRLATSARPRPGQARPTLSAIRRQVRTLLMRTGQRLPDLAAVAWPFRTAASGAPGAIA
jgi:hypothetical protein